MSPFCHYGYSVYTQYLHAITHNDIQKFMNSVVSVLTLILKQPVVQYHCCLYLYIDKLLSLTYKVFTYLTANMTTQPHLCSVYM